MLHITKIDKQYHGEVQFFYEINNYLIVGKEIV